MSEEELILFAVKLDNLTLTETLTSYGDPQDPLLPVGELARLLDLDISVFPPEQRVTGRLGEEARALTVDLRLGLARIGGKDVRLAPGEVALSQTDMFIRASALERLLPIDIQADAEALEIKLIALEKLPVQARMERAGRLEGINNSLGTVEPMLRIASPYNLFTPPAFDIALESGSDSRSGFIQRRYDVRVAGDVLYTGFKAYVGSDETGDPSTARVEFSRRSPEGGLLGPLDATYVAGGDVYTPQLGLGPHSAGGRGISFTTAKLENASVFQRINLRGELPIGYDVELYINDVLRSGQRQPVDGRYEFLDVPLVRGLNVIRIVTYGPRGERSEETRIINVGGGQLAQGETAIDFGVVQQGRNVIDLQQESEILPGNGGVRAVASLAYGLSEELTLIGGAALFPGGEGRGRRELMSLGARGSLFGLAAQADLARDFGGGTGAAFGIAGQPFGVSLVGRHAEYWGGFLDETNRVYDARRPLRRHSELTLDFALPPIGGKIIPLSFRLERDVFRDGGTSWTGLGRASTTIAQTLVSAGLDYTRDQRPDSDRQQRLTGNITLSRFIDFKWQVRGVLDYDLVPDSRLRALTLLADRNVSERLGFRLGAGKTFGEGKDLTVQGAAFLRLPFADLAFSGDYATARKDWRLGVRLAFGLAFDPGARNYRVTRPGPAAGGSAAFHAFTDRNGNGVFDAGEEPVAGVAIDGAERKAVTGPDGRAFLTGLGDSVTGRLKADIENIDAFFVTSPPGNIEISPRPGKVVEIPYPLAPISEVLVRVTVRQGDGQPVGLSALRVRMVREGAEPIEAVTEFDGSVVIGNLRPGTYRLELEPDQARRLNMRLAAPVEVTVREDGRTPDVNAEAVFGTPAD
ncbi:MAG TPA: hypothetical protein VGD10_13310 [Allosphingosinicella sp.]|uniref:hypothetical protein n=1 Tax=Allosphingosinicella sp. TaxID=2823234 RepID=UPI002ED9B7B6